MRRVTLLILLGCAFAVPAGHAATGYAVGDTAVELTAPDQYGHPHRLSDYVGRWVLLDVCAAWSKPSRDMAADAAWARPEIPFEYVACLAVGDLHVASTRGDAVKWAKRSGHRWTVLHDDGGSGALIGWLEAAGIDTIPTQVIIGPDGMIRMIHAGYRSLQDIYADMEELARAARQLPPPDPWRYRAWRNLPRDPR